MRAFIIALSALAILGSVNVANAGPSLENRELVASADSAVVVQEATQETEDQVGLDKGKRRDVQRRLTKLGFATKANGRFDKSTRAVIARWQAARGYPDTRFLNNSQHQALLTDSALEARASLESTDKSEAERPARRRAGGRHHNNAGGPVAFIGGVVGGLFGRR
jgi:peptidoglycan hydrolase-like protein with peptidoglycan-binding domain